MKRKPRGRDWTEAELKILFDNYPTKTAAEMEALLPDRINRLIITKANHFGIKKTAEYKRSNNVSKRKSFFTDQDNEWIRLNYSNSTAKQLRERFPERTRHQVTQRALRMSVRKYAKHVKEGCYTPNEDEIMIKHYATTLSADLQKMLPGRTGKSIGNHAAKLKLKKEGLFRNPGNKTDRFTDKEKAILTKWYPVMSATELKKKLPNHGEYVINKKAANMGLKKDPELKEKLALAKKSIVDKPKFGDRSEDKTIFKMKPIDKSNPVKIGDLQNTTVYAKPGRNHDEVRREYFAARERTLKSLRYA